MAVALLILLLLLLGAFDIGRLLLTKMALQHAVREGGRFAVTGRCLALSGEPLSRVDSIVQIVIEEAEPLVALPPGGVLVSSATGGPNSAGGPGDVITIRVSHRVSLITPVIAQAFPNGVFAFEVSSVFKNEPFPPSFPQ
jgi:hypothetical protein